MAVGMVVWYGGSRVSVGVLVDQRVTSGHSFCIRKSARVRLGWGVDGLVGGAAVEAFGASACAWLCGVS